MSTENHKVLNITSVKFHSSNIPCCNDTELEVISWTTVLYTMSMFVGAYLNQKLSEVFIVDFNLACCCLESDLFAFPSCEHEVTIIWQYTRPTELNHQSDIKKGLYI